MDAIDAMVRDLYAMRSRLVGEIRASDDATAARADAMLAAAPDPDPEWQEFRDNLITHAPGLWAPVLSPAGENSSVA